MRAWIALVFLAASAAHAGTCTKIEYADARDWPVEKLERQYCTAMKAGEIEHKLWQDLRGQGLLSGANSRSIMADYTACLDQQALMGRVLENVHKRPLPVCK